jgi:hypothetical protein
MSARGLVRFLVIIVVILVLVPQCAQDLKALPAKAGHLAGEAVNEVVTAAGRAIGEAVTAAGRDVGNWARTLTCGLPLVGRSCDHCAGSTAYDLGTCAADAARSAARQGAADPTMCVPPSGVSVSCSLRGPYLWGPCKTPEQAMDEPGKNALDETLYNEWGFVVLRDKVNGGYYATRPTKHRWGWTVQEIMGGGTVTGEDYQANVNEAVDEAAKAPACFRKEDLGDPYLVHSHPGNVLGCNANDNFSAIDFDGAIANASNRAMGNTLRKIYMVSAHTRCMVSFEADMHDVVLTGAESIDACFPEKLPPKYWEYVRDRQRVVQCYP